MRNRPIAFCLGLSVLRRHPSPSRHTPVRRHRFFRMLAEGASLNARGQRSDISQDHARPRRGAVRGRGAIDLPEVSPLVSYSQLPIRGGARWTRTSDISSRTAMKIA